MDKKKILIVDDEEDVLKVLSKRLGLAGYSVIMARNGKDAIKTAKSELPDLILLDINMPEMDGGEAGQILKGDPATKDIPILFLTCLVTKKEEKETKNVIGSNFFIAKPYDSDELLKQIEKHI